MSYKMASRALKRPPKGPQEVHTQEVPKTALRGLKRHRRPRRPKGSQDRLSAFQNGLRGLQGGRRASKRPLAFCSPLSSSSFSSS
eukprot:9492785-Pyramimonas_sp.AAC.1